MEQQGTRFLLEEIASFIDQYLYQSSAVWLGLTVLLCLNVACLLVCTLLRSRRRGWNSTFFVLLCISVVVWTVGTLAPYLLPYLPSPLANSVFVSQLMYPLRLVGFVFMPTFLCLHVWRQISHHEISNRTLVVGLLPPVLFSCTIVYNLATAPVPAEAVLWARQGVGRVLLILYISAALVKTYQLMLSVLYQMPAHMRKTTHRMLAGVFFLVLACFLTMLLSGLPPYDFVLLGTHIMLGFLYSAFGLASASNVIVTSREFVFNNLSTMVLVLGRHKTILDWNHKGSNTACLALPTPRYNEPFYRYYQRIIIEAGGRASPHDANVITTTAPDGSEGQFLISTQKVSGNKTHYGFLVEISEVTPIYRVLRFMEEIAVEDQLTGLQNRNGYIRAVQQMVAPQHMPLLIVVGDVNNLKLVNDSYGHLRGDRLLEQTAQALKRHQLPGAFLARIGGDEFVMLAPGSSMEAGRDFVRGVDREFELASTAGGVAIGVSWGYSLMEDAEQDYNDAFNRADAMMYRVKRQKSTFRSSGIVPLGHVPPHQLKAGAVPPGAPPGPFEFTMPEGEAPAPPAPPGGGQDAPAESTGAAAEKDAVPGTPVGTEAPPPTDDGPEDTAPETRATRSGFWRSGFWRRRFGPK